MNAKTATSTALVESTTSAVWGLLDATDRGNPRDHIVRSIIWEHVLDINILRLVCGTHPVRPGTCWWSQWCWRGPGCWSPPGWCWHSRCRAPETCASDAPHTPLTAARHRTWCYAPECSWGLTQLCRLRWGCWGREIGSYRVCPDFIFKYALSVRYVLYVPWH